MEKKILEFLESVAHIPYWDREPAIDNATLNEMIEYLRKGDSRA